MKKLKVGLTTKEKEKNEGINTDEHLFTYEFDELDEEQLSNLFKQHRIESKELFKDLKDSDVVTYLMDLEIEGKKDRMGGCKVSVKTIKAVTSVTNIMEFAEKELIRQLKNTLNEVK